MGRTLLNRWSVIGLGLIAAAGLLFAVSPASASRAGGPAITRVAPKAGAIAAPSSAPTNLVTIFNNFGPGYAYSCCVGWTVSLPGGAGLSKSAMPFTPSASTWAAQIDVALGHVTGANNATIKLAQDNGGLPGTVLRTWSVANQPAFGTCCGVVSLGVSPLVALGAGKRYWVIAEAGPNGANNTWDAWNYNSTGDNGGGAQDGGSGYVFYPGQPRGAFDVLGCAKICKVAP